MLRATPASGSQQMQSAQRRVLAAALPGALFAALAPALERSEFDLNQVASYDSARELARWIAFDVLLLGFQAPGDGALDLVDAVHDPESASRDARLLVFAPPESLAAAERALARRVDRVLSTERGEIEQQEVVLELLRERVRLAARVLARLTVRIAEDASRIVCQTRDLSRSGMLAITDNRYPVGAAVQFVLDLPEGAEGIAGDAEVVRHAEPPRDRVTGLGLRFLSFRAGHEERLVAFLSRHGA